MSGFGIDPLSEIVHFNREAAGHRAEDSGANANARLLHPQKDRHKRLVDGVVDIEQG